MRWVWRLSWAGTLLRRPHVECRSCSAPRFCQRRTPTMSSSCCERRFLTYANADRFAAPGVRRFIEAKPLDRHKTGRICGPVLIQCQEAAGTGTISLPLDFESRRSTSSAIPQPELADFRKVALARRFARMPRYSVARDPIQRHNFRTALRFRFRITRRTVAQHPPASRGTAALHRMAGVACS